MANEIRRCLLCRSSDVATRTERERFVTATCRACGAVVRVEFNPPDGSGVRGRIEVLAPPSKTIDPADPVS
jgi:hypothetical protein